MVSPPVAVARTACALVALGLAPVVSTAGPVLASAEARIASPSPTSCTVELTLAVDGADRVEHRIESAPGSRVELIEIRGATQVAASRNVGRTVVLLLSLSQPVYTLRYAVEQPPSRAYHCPLWLPAVPADGRARQVQLRVTIPPGATFRGTMPAFRWTGSEGTATLSHLPAFVRVPYSGPGEPAPWDIARVMDILTVMAVFGASAVWAYRRR